MNDDIGQVSPEIAGRFRDEVIAPLRRVGRALRWRLVLAGTTMSAAILAACLSAMAAIDYLLVLGIGPRAALLAIVWSCVVLAARKWLWRPVTRRIDAVEIASLLERADSSLRDALISAVSFASRGTSTSDSPALVRAVVEQARERFASMRPRAILNDHRHRRVLAAMGLLALSGAGFSWTRPELTATILARDLLLQDVAWPSRTRIRLEGAVGHRLIRALGDELNLVAAAEGAIPPSLRAEIALPDGQSAIRDMIRRGDDQFILEYGPLTSAMRLRFRVGRFGVDEATDWYDIDAVERPSIREASMTLTPPAYTGQPLSALPPGQTSAEALPGSRVTITATANKPIVSAVLRTADREVAPATIESPQRLVASFEPAGTVACYFDLRDEGGLEDLRPVTYAIRVVNDPPPKAQFTLPGCGEMVVVDAVLDLEIRCADNLGLKNIELLCAVNQAGASDAATPSVQREALRGFDPGAARFETRLAWPLSAMAPRVGDQLRLWVRAEDYQPESGSARPGLAESPPCLMRVVSPEELLAELGRRESEWRREFEHILKSQEGLSKRTREWHDKARADAGRALDAAYAREETSQRGQIGRLKTVRRQFEQILDELKINQLADAAVRKRLDGGVIGPLGRLATTDVVRIADQMERLRAGFDPALADRIEQGHDQLLREMHDILANMLKWEGYNEAVGLLRDVIRLQGDVNRETRKRLDEQVENLFKQPPRDRLQEE